MNYCIVESGKITNIIVCENDKVAKELEAVPSYNGAAIGQPYDPPNFYDPQYTELQLLGQQMTDLELLVMDHISAQTKTEEETV